MIPFAFRNIRSLLQKNAGFWWLFFPFYAWQTWMVKDNCFFWDTVQFGSLHPHWYYENDFRYFWLPEKWDSGHPPFFGMYIAACWKIWGQSLAASHFAMLPWLFLTVANWYRTVRTLTVNRSIFWVLLCLFSNPVWASQSTLVSPDVVLSAFFAMALNGIFNNRRSLILTAVAGLCLISTRGMVVSAVLLGFQFLSAILFQSAASDPAKKRIFRSVFILYLPGWVLAFLYLALHYIHNGWFGYYAASSWNTSFDVVHLPGLLRNIIVLVWRLVDYGHIFIWGIIFCFLIYLKKRKGQSAPFQKKIGLLLLLLGATFAVLTIPFSGLLGHRYFLPVYWTAEILALMLVINHLDQKRRFMGILLILLALLTGNRWIYPPPVANGWDSTLAHLPYYGLRLKMMDYMDQEGINFSVTGTEFPNKLSTRYIDLSATDRFFAAKDLRINKYVFYSNIYNDFTPAELSTLEKEWLVVQSYEKWGVRVVLYKKIIDN